MTVTSVTTSTTSQFTVSSGNELLVESGGNVTSTTVLSGGSLVVSGGVETSATISSGGTETVSSGGSATGDQIFGTATVTGTSATVTSETVFSGGVIDLFSGSANGTTVSSGGRLLVSGGNTASNTTLVSGGTVELATSGAVLSGSLTFSGGGNTLQLDKIVSATKGDQAIITGFTATDEIVVSGAGTSPTLAVTSASGSNEVVATITSGGTTDSFTLSGSQYTTTDVSWTSAGGGIYDLTTTYTSALAGTTTSVTTSTASGAYTETSGNTLLVLSGGSVSAATIDSGAFLTVDGGADFAATVSAGGTETVSAGSATGDFIFGTATTVSGGSGVFTNETVENGGVFDLYNGNSAAGTTVLGGGLFFLSGDNGAVTDTVLSGGGTLELDSPKANISGSLTFEGGGNTLDIAAVASSGFGELATISGFSSTDKIDVTAFGAGATLSFASSGGNEDVTISSTSGSETFIFSGTSTYTSSTLALVSNGSRDDIEYNSSGFPSGTISALSAGSYSALTVSSLETLVVPAGASVVSTTVSSGGTLDIDGGADTSATVSSGGTETVSSGGSATGDQIFGGVSVSDAGATVTSETVQSGGTLTIGSGTVDSASTVLAGGSETVFGSATGDQIYGLLSVDGGTVSSETIESGGSATFGSGAVDSDMTVLAGGQVLVSAATGSATLSGDQIFGVVSTVSGLSATFTNETVYSGGLLFLANSNNANGTTVLSGGELVLSGKETATDTTLSGGGIVELDSPKATLSGSLTFEGGGNTLEIADTTDAGDGTLATISGFSSSDKIDITSAAYPGSALTLSQTVSGGDTVAQVISAGTTVETFTFANPALAGELALLPDGSGGVDLEIVPVDVTTSVTTSTASGAYTELATDTLLVLSGGSVSAPTIDAGGFLVVNGGADTSATILAGGLETISAGTATGDQIYGSAIVSGGTVTGETVLSGGGLTVDNGAVSNIVLNGGGLLDLATATATISGSLTFANGFNTLEASAIANSGAGDQAVISGFSTSDKIEVTGISPSGASLSFSAGPNGEEIATISGTGGSESFIFANGTTYNASTMSLAPDGSGVDLVLDTTPVVTFTSLSGLQTNDATQIVNGTVDTAVDPYAIGTTVSVIEDNEVIGTGTVGANGYWSAQVTLQNDDGVNTLSATDTDKAGNTGSTTQSLTYNVDTTAAAFTPGDLVISISGDGDGSGTYGDNQASPITLEEITTTGTIVSQIVLPQTTTVVNGVTEYAISGEYGSSSEGTLELSADGHSLVIAGYGVNADTYNEGGAAVYGNAALAQSTSIPGGEYTAVPRVIADINADGVVDTSTALYDVFNTNNPRSVATVNGSSFYISGQGVKGDTTQGVFYATDGASSATSINDATDTRTAEIYDGQLYVSADSTQGATGIYDYGPLSGVSPPSGQVTPTVVIPGTVTLNGSNGNTVNGSEAGETVNLSPENFFFANSTTLYVADGGDPKNGGVGDGGLQKWTFNGTQWVLDYTLSAGLNLVSDTSSSGTSGLIGLTGEVLSNGTVELFATNETLTDLGQTYVYEITDQLSATTPAPDESFTAILTASPDENIRGISFAPTPYAPTISGTVANQTTTDEAPVTPFSAVTIGDQNSNAVETLTITLSGGGTLADGPGFDGLTNEGGGVYGLSGTAAAVTSELEALVFTPTAGAPNSSNTTTFTLSDLSSANSTPTVDSTTSVTDTDLAIAPTITGTTSGQTTTSEAPVTPFSTVTIGDANSGATDTLTITLSGSGGTLADGPGFDGLTNEGGGVYSLSGTAAAVSGELDALVFTPTAGPANSSNTTTFTLSDLSSAYATPTVDSTTSVTDTDPPVAPTITGTTSGQTTTSEAPVTPFSGVTIGDANSGATDTLTITLSGGGGTLAGTGLVATTPGVYTLSGTAATITSELDALTFTPTAGEPNTSSSTTFTLSDLSSAYSTPTINSNTSVTDTDPAVAPTITGTKSGQTTTSEAPVTPFSAVTIGDANSDATDTLTITLSGSGGTLADGPGFDGLTNDGGGVYSLSGTATAVSSELDALVFTPTAGAPGSSNTTTLTLSDLSSAYPTPTVDSTTSVTDVDPAVSAVAPTITGTKAGQTTTSEAPIKPFSGVTIGDPNSGATDKLTITLSGGGGTLAGTGLVATTTPGVYTLSGTAATITSELDALKFTPTAGAPNTATTTTFTLSDLSSAYSTPTVNSTTSVTDIDPAVAPTITGTKSGQTTTSEAPIKPFSGVTIGDTNSGTTDTLTITLSGGGGTLTGAGLVATGTPGVYTLSGSAATITSELDALKFTPTAGAPNTATKTTFTLSDVTSADTSAVNSATTVTDIDPAVAPTITGTLVAQTTTPVKPFSGLTVADSNSGTTDTLTITLSGDGGTLSGTGLTRTSADVYKLSGSATTITTELDALTFTPAAAAPNTVTKTVFTLSDVTSANTDTTLVVSVYDFGNGNTFLNLTGSYNEVIGGGGNDEVTITGDDNSIALGNGNDVVAASGADNVITVGSGTDTITAEDGSDTITAGNGNDTVSAGADSTVTLGNGNDTVSIGANSVITVGNGRDTVTAGAGDTITLGRGDDTVAFGGTSRIPSAVGSETVVGFTSSDVINFNAALFTNFGTSATFATVMADTTQTSAGAKITLPDGEGTILLAGVKASSLTAHNFTFS